MNNHQYIPILLVLILLLSGCATGTTGGNTVEPVDASTPPPTTGAETGQSTEQNEPAQPTATPRPTDTPEPTPAPPTNTPPPPTEAPAGADLADVISVEASGQPGSYQFSVGISSPDTGCQQYADWWEVLSEEGELIYRRVLLHSHAGEQPFVRSGGPVNITADQVVWVRAHMNPGGYGGAAFKGSVEGGFQPAQLGPAFAPEAAGMPPLPDGCAF